MFVYLRSLLFYFLLLFLLLVVVCCTFCDGVDADDQPSPATNKNSIQILQVGNINIALKKDGNNVDKQKNIFVKDYYSPFLVSAGDVLLALVGVNSSNENNDKNVTIISKHIVTGEKDSGWGKNILSDGTDDINGGWKTQFAVQDKLKDDGPSVREGMLATAKG